MTVLQQAGALGVGAWPDWARAQLDRALVIAAQAPAGAGVAATLHREWFAPALTTRRTPRGPLAGLYRAAHAGARVGGGAAARVDRHDVVGADGWWRTWGRSWTPPRTRPGSVRVLLSADPDRLAEFVQLATGTLLGEDVPWSLAVATEARRVGRAGAGVLDLPAEDESGPVITRLLARLAPVLSTAVTPLARPLAPGAALAQYPDNGMSFGEHRCHLVALGVRRAGGRDPLESIARVFAAHGIEPGRPYRTR